MSIHVNTALHEVVGFGADLGVSREHCLGIAAGKGQGEGRSLHGQGRRRLGEPGQFGVRADGQIKSPRLPPPKQQMVEHGKPRPHLGLDAAQLCGQGLEPFQQDVQTAARPEKVLGHFGEYFLGQCIGQFVESVHRARASRFVTLLALV